MNSNLRILHLEDSPNDAELIRSRLESGGIECVITRVESKEAFCEALDRQRFDLILSDFSVPSFDGRSALQMARENARNVPFIFVSGTIGEEAAIQSLVDGATDYVLKHRMDRLIPAVRRALKELQERRSRMEAEAALRASEQSFRMLFADNPHPMWVYDLETFKFLEVNAAAVSKYGYTRDEFLGMRIIQIRPPEDTPDLQDDLKKERVALESTRDWRHRLKDGRIIHVDITSHTLSFGGRKAVLVIAQDITKRKEAEEKLQESREYLTQVIDCIADPVFVKDGNRRYLYVNRAECELTGVSREQMIGKTSTDFFPSEQANVFTANDDLVLNGEKENVSEEGVVDAQGKPHTMVTKKRLLCDKAGNKSIVGVMRDMTEWKRSEEALRASEEKFRLISENVADLIAVLDLRGRRVYSSPSYKKVLGDPDQLRGSDSFVEIHPEDRERMKAIFGETVRTGVGQRSEYRFVSGDGRIHSIESQGSVIRDKHGTIINVLVVSRDVTEQKALEQQFLRAQRLESLGTLASGIAHDLNNVLAPILLGLEILKKSVSGESGLRTLQTLEKSAQRGRDIVKQVLTFGRGIVGERGMLQLRHIVKDTVSIIEETFPRSIEVKEIAPKDTWTIKGDATQLHQLMMNLCVNARDAMPEGGTLRISLENVTIDPQYARMNLEAREGRFVLLVVEDSGTGITPDTMDRMFDPFFTTKATGKGTGLGLSTVHTIVKNHEGFIKVYSDIGKGTAFRVYLPATEDSIPSAGKESDVKLLEGQGELILLIDDEASVCEITKQTLDAFGYRTITAPNGENGLALFRARKNEISLVITDMMMPVMGGQQTIRMLRGLNPNVKIIGSSGLMSDDRVDSLKVDQADGYITKPYTAQTLLKAVNEVLRGSLQ
jgi:hypothetical protein